MNIIFRGRFEQILSLSLAKNSYKILDKIFMEYLDSIFMTLQNPSQDYPQIMSQIPQTPGQDSRTFLDGVLTELLEGFS